MKKDKPKFFEQIKILFRVVKEKKPYIVPILISITVVILLVFSVIIIFTRLWLLIPLGILLSLFVPLFILARIATKIGFSEIEGKSGAVGAVLGNVGLGWVFEEQPVAASQKMDFVFRGTGRAGVVLVSEGPSGRVRKMLSEQKKKYSRILPNVTIYTLEAGDQNGQIPLKKLKKNIVKLKAQLTKQELTEVRKRLASIGGFSLPIPKGIDPMKVKGRGGSARAMRG